VTLTLDRWEHILKKRLGKLDGLELAVMSAVENAEVTRRGNVPGREVHYARDLGPIALDGRGSSVRRVNGSREHRVSDPVRTADGGQAVIPIKIG
jgi:hypothetical protein